MQSYKLAMDKSDYAIPHCDWVSLKYSQWDRLLQPATGQLLTDTNIHHYHIEHSSILSVTMRRTQPKAHLTAGASTDSMTVPNPADRTAAETSAVVPHSIQCIILPVACKRPIATLVPNGMSFISGFPMSRTMKKNQSVKL